MGRLSELKLTDDEMRKIPNTISVVRQVTETHPNLGVRVAFNKLCDIANIGCMNVGIQGCGKSASLHGVMSLQHRLIFQKKFTLAASKRFSKTFSNTELSWICLEMSDLSDIVMENMFRVVGDLIYDHYCEINTSSYVCNIQNSYVSFLAACTYEIFNKMWQLVTWRGTTKDRVARYFVFAYNLDMNRINLDKPAPKITINFPSIDTIKVDTSYFEEIVEMLTSQFSPQRAYDYSNRLLKASASLNHQHVATDADAKFILLNRPNIEAEKWASSKKSISSPLVIDTDALQLLSEALINNGVSMQALAKKETLIGGISSILTSVYRYPKLFTRVEDWVFARAELIRDNIAPQIAFEKRCLKEGTKYYLR